jgi:hypothetical protein
MTVLAATKDLRRVALWLGHATTQTTEMYVRADAAVKLETITTGLAQVILVMRSESPETQPQSSTTGR